MTAVPKARMRAEEFLAWTGAQPEGERYELVAGEIVGMAAERLAHARVKGQVFRALGDAIRQAGLPCEALPDGMAVRIDEDTIYEPDAMVRCGPELPDDVVILDDPVIVVEVISPSSRARDTGAKLEDYFRLPSVRHYLIVKTENRRVIHHARDERGLIQTRIVREGGIELRPPGLRVEIGAFFV